MYEKLMNIVKEKNLKTYSNIGKYISDSGIDISTFNDNFSFGKVMELNCEESVKFPDKNEMEQIPLPDISKEYSIFVDDNYQIYGIIYTDKNDIITVATSYSARRAYDMILGAYMSKIYGMNSSKAQVSKIK